MTLERFSECIAALNEFYRREELFSQAMEPFNSSYTIIEFCPTIPKLIHKIIKEDFDDKFDNFSYWFFDQDQGKASDKYYITEADGTIIKNKTKEDIYNYLLKCQREKC